MLPVEPGVHGLRPAVLPTAGLLKTGFIIPDKSLPIWDASPTNPLPDLLLSTVLPTAGPGDHPGGGVLGNRLLPLLALSRAMPALDSAIISCIGVAIMMFLRICQVTCSR